MLAQARARPKGAPISAASRRRSQQLDAGGLTTPRAECAASQVVAFGYTLSDISAQSGGGPLHRLRGR